MQHNIDIEENQAFPSHEPTAGWFSKWTFSYFMPIMQVGYHKSLEMNDIWDLIQEDKAEVSHKQFLMIKENHHVVLKLYTIVRPLLIQQVTVGILSCFLTLVNPLCLQYLLTNLHGPTINLFYCLVVMTISSCVNSLLHGRAYFLGRRIGTRVRAILISEIYYRALHKRIIISSTKEATHGEIVNLMAVDTQKVLDYACYMHYLFTTPLQIIICSFVLYTVLGISAFVGIALMFLILPLQKKLAKDMQAIQKLLLSKTDIRINKLNEMLQSIRIIKYFAWEERFENQVNESRNQELFYLRQFRFIMALMDVIYMSIPILIPLITFSVFTGIFKGILTPSNVFTTLSLLQILKHPLRDLPDQIIKYYETKVSMERISNFIQPDAPVKHAGIAPEISFKNASFGISESFKIKPFSLTIPNNKLTIVIGSTSSGKSTLLQSILQEIPLLAGSCFIPNSPISNVPQQPWLQHATIRQNILFGSPFNEKLYHSVLYNACLLPDLEILPGSDFTEIGQGGINLSGGQRQRIALARALYQNNDINLFDDVFSAVDASTQKHILHNCILGQLKGKTNIIATHATHLLLPHADFIIIMDNGTVTHSGTFEQLRDVLTRQRHITSSSEAQHVPFDDNKIPEIPDSGGGTRLIDDEEKSSGNVQFQIYKFYISCSGGILLWLLLSSGEFINHGLRLSQDYWLNLWSTSNSQTSHYLTMYVILSLGSIFFTFLFLVIEYQMALKGSKRIHELVLQNILRGQIGFFDKTPIGRIINRFSKDIQVVDRNVTASLLTVLYCTLGTLVIILMIIAIAPISVIGMVPVCMGYFYISKYYLHTSRELKKLESINKSPIYSLFSETLLGSDVIRAFQKQEMMLNDNYNRINYYQRAFFYLWVSNRWLGVRTEWLGSLVTFLSGLAIILSINWISPGLAGLCMSYSFTFTDQVLWMVRYNAELEMNMNSVERIQEYVELEQEREQLCPNKVSPAWPLLGNVSVRGLTLRYSADLAPVLNNIYFEISKGEKIAVVGRTGAGTLVY